MENEAISKKIPFILLEIVVIFISGLFFYLSWHGYKDQQVKIKWPIATAEITGWKNDHVATKWVQTVLIGKVKTPTGNYLFEIYWGYADWNSDKGWIPRKNVPKSGSVLIVRYNPVNPSEVVIKEVPSDKFLFLGLGALLLFIALSLYYVFLKPKSLRMNRHDRRKKYTG